MPAQNDNHNGKGSWIKDIGWPHAVIAIVGLILIFLMLDYSFGNVELPGGIKIELYPPSTPEKTPFQTRTVSIVSVEEAIRSYYTLIKQQQYALAWAMATVYCSSKGLSFEEYIDEWKRSGSAEIIEPISVIENNNSAEVTVNLYYPHLNTTLIMRYGLIRDPSQGSERLGFWLFTTGERIQ